MALNGYVFYELIEFKKAVLVNATNEFSDDFKFMKNFADRNIEVYTLVSSVLVGVVTFVIGFGFKFDFDRRIKGLTAQFESLKHDHEGAKRIHNGKIESLINTTNKKFADIFDHLSDSIAVTDLDLSVYLKIVALNHFFELFQKGVMQEEGFVESMNLRIQDLLNDATLISARSVNLQNVELLDSLIVICPPELRLVVSKFVMAYHRKIESFR